eukprot:m.200491 g.200491  ORF g.200491 m.200491 type:complete len:87 (-) comp13710_c0_seq3:4901-5161(-)
MMHSKTIAMETEKIPPRTPCHWLGLGEGLQTHPQDIESVEDTICPRFSLELHILSSNVTKLPWLAVNNRPTRSFKCPVWTNLTHTI